MPFEYTLFYVLKSEAILKCVINGRDSNGKVNVYLLYPSKYLNVFTSISTASSSSKMVLIPFLYTTTLIVREPGGSQTSGKHHLDIHKIMFRIIAMPLFQIVDK